MEGRKINNEIFLACFVNIYGINFLFCPPVTPTIVNMDAATAAKIVVGLE
jgi:hypothetical protein